MSLKSFFFDGDNNTGILHVFEIRIGMNEFDHRILALLKQVRERPAFLFVCSKIPLVNVVTMALVISCNPVSLLFLFVSFFKNQPDRHQSLPVCCITYVFTLP